MKQSIRQFLAKPLIIAMLTAPLSISAYAHEPPSILDFAVKAKSATPSNATYSDAEDIVDNFFDIRSEEIELSTASNATPSEATPSDAELATDSNATPSNAEPAPFQPIGGYFRSSYEYVLPNAKKDGFDFIEWNTKADGTGTSYSAGESIRITGEMELYAIWKEIREEEALYGAETVE